MPQADAFHTPAEQQDLSDDPAAQARLDALWSARCDGFTEQSITGDQWGSTYAGPNTAYYNPLRTDMPPSANAAPVTWTAMPHRLRAYLGATPGNDNPYQYSDEQLWELADTGYVTDSAGERHPLPDIPVVVCPDADWKGPRQKYGPYGPRGWQDEYCEWSVVRDGAGKITRVDFTCENPEYWYSLWRVSPDRVAELYESTLNAGLTASAPHIKVTVDDLVLRDPATGRPVLDPATGQPAYNPLNKWNTGPEAIRAGGDGSRGGAMHLTSTPNTLQTEVGLAGAATGQRSIGGRNPNDDPQALICCAKYGQNFRNSDPNIGQNVNLLVSAGFDVSLANPIGLYIQTPNFSAYRLPDDPNLPPGATAADCWHVVRGTTKLRDRLTGNWFDLQFILHAAFQIPQSWIDAGVSFTVGDITISGKPIRWAAQITETFHVGLNARPIPQRAPAEPQPCVGTAEPPLPQPFQLMPTSLWDAYYATPTTNPVGVATTLANNTVIVPPTVRQGQTDLDMTLTCTGVARDAGGALPQVQFDGGGVVASVVAFDPDVEYTVPGNSYPSRNQTLRLRVDVAADATPGVRGVVIISDGQPGQPVTAPAYLDVATAAEES